MADGRDALVKMLAATPLGRGLSVGDVEKVAGIAVVEQLDPPEVLFQEGAICDCLYLVTAGLVGLDMCMPRQGCVRILTVGPGEFVGWSAIVGDGRMTTRATIVEPATLIGLPGDQLRSLCNDDHDIGYGVMHQVAIDLSRRLLATRLQMLDVFGETQPVAGRETAPATSIPSAQDS